MFFTLHLNRNSTIYRSPKLRPSVCIEKCVGIVCFNKPMSLRKHLFMKLKSLISHISATVNFHTMYNNTREPLGKGGEPHTWCLVDILLIV